MEQEHARVPAGEDAEDPPAADEHVPLTLPENATDSLADFFWRVVGIYLDASSLAIHIVASNFCTDNSQCLAKAVHDPAEIVRLFREGGPFSVDIVTNIADRLMLELFMVTGESQWSEAAPAVRPSQEEAESNLVSWLMDGVRLEGENEVRRFVRSIMHRDVLGACHRPAVVIAFARNALTEDTIRLSLGAENAARLTRHLSADALRMGLTRS